MCNRHHWLVPELSAHPEREPRAHQAGILHSSLPRRTPPTSFLSLWVFQFWIFHVHRAGHYVAFCVWLLPPITKSSKCGGSLVSSAQGGGLLQGTMGQLPGTSGVASTCSWHGSVSDLSMQWPTLHHLLGGGGGVVLTFIDATRAWGRLHGEGPLHPHDLAESYCPSSFLWVGNLTSHGTSSSLDTWLGTLCHF